jgi:hypothetical protein
MLHHAATAVDADSDGDCDCCGVTLLPLEHSLLCS